MQLIYQHLVQFLEQMSNTELSQLLQYSSTRTWPIFFYRYIVPYDDRLSIKNDNLVTWGDTELAHIPLLMVRYPGDAFR